MVMKNTSGWTWMAAGLLILLILALPLPSRSAPPTERTFHLQASRFQYAPGVLRANPGDQVTLELESADVVHGLTLDGYPVELVAEPGQTARLTFVAEKSGVFRFHCTVTCGNLHPFMIGKLYVGSNTLLWRVSALAVLLVGLGLWKRST